MYQLLGSPASPYVRKVRVLVREADAASKVQEVVVSTSPMASAAEVVTANPVGKIPVLIRPEGPSVYDSRVICRYLDAKLGAGLFPESRIWEVLTLEATADAILDAAVGLVYEARFRPEALQFPEWQDAQWAKISRALDTLEKRWMSHLSGPSDMGKIAVACALSYLDFRHDKRQWRKVHGDLDDWHTAFRSRPSMADTSPF